MDKNEFYAAHQLSENERNQLLYLKSTIDDILNLQEDELSHDLHIKFDTTPDNEKLTLCRDELKAIQLKMLEYRNEIKELVSGSVNNFRRYHNSYVQKKNTKDSTISNDDYPDQWQEIFITNYALYYSEGFMEFDYNNLDFEKFEDSDLYWYHDPEQYIPLKGLNELIDCLKTINFFFTMFEFYHLSLENKEINLNRHRKRLTFNWLSNPERELPELYNRMNDKFIAKVDFPAFRAIFTGQPAESIDKKLKWNLDDVVLLAYFIYQLSERKKISKRDFWSKTKYCFENAESLKQSNYNYKNNKSGLPKQHNLIDELLQDL